MTTGRLNSATVQVVRSGSTGGVTDASQMVLQVITGEHTRRIMVGQLVAQIIRQGDAGAVFEASSMAVQVIRQGSTGARFQTADAGVDVVWTQGVPESDRQRAWFFDFDGHSFYVLDLAERGALLFDLVTQQWTRFDTQGYEGHWNMKNGFHWRAGKEVVGGTVPTISANNVVYKLDPGSFFDDGWRPVTYEVRGVLFATDVGHHRQYALRLMGSAGRTADTVAPVLNMQFSDDQAQTWSKEYTVELTADTRQRIEFRSLGAFTHPGRIFRLYDDGGVKFIAAVVGDVEGEA